MDEHIFIIFTVIGVILYSVLSGVIIYGLLSVVIRIASKEWPGIDDYELWATSYKLSSSIHLLIALVLLMSAVLYL